VTPSVPAGQETHLPITGERTVPGIAEENYWFRRHEIAYLELARLCAGKIVLEAGCGEGYGAELLSRGATRVVALDYDAFTAAHVARRYPRLHVVRGNLAALPLATASVEVVVNLQVIEHLWDQAGFLRECARVLRPGGTLLVSTPNRITFSPGRDTPLNPFHTRELAADELGELLVECGFTVDSMRGLHHGDRLRPRRRPRRFLHRRPAEPLARRAAVAGAAASRCGIYHRRGLPDHRCGRRRQP